LALDNIGGMEEHFLPLQDAAISPRMSIPPKQCSLYFFKSLCV